MRFLCQISNQLFCDKFGDCDMAVMSQTVQPVGKQIGGDSLPILDPSQESAAWNPQTQNRRHSPELHGHNPETPFAIRQQRCPDSFL